MSYVGNTPADKFLTLEKQQFSVSATTNYTLSHSVSSPQELRLVINNVPQNPNSSYTVNGTALTLSSATSSGDTMYCVFLGKAIGTVAPATGSVTNNMLVNSGITLNGSAVSLGGSATIASGITDADQFRLTATITNTNADITANLERVDNATFAKIGNGMSLSSGIFTFPSTGLYYVVVQTFFQAKFDGHEILHNISSDGGSNYATTSSNDIGYFGTEYVRGTVFGQVFINVTNTTNFRMKFTTSGMGNSVSTVIGNTDMNKTSFTFIRLGDSQ